MTKHNTLKLVLLASILSSNAMSMDDQSDNNHYGNKNIITYSSFPQDSVGYQDYDDIDFSDNTINLGAIDKVGNLLSKVGNLLSDEKTKKVLVKQGTAALSDRASKLIKATLPGGEILVPIVKGTAKACGYENATDAIVNGETNTKGIIDNIVSGTVEFSKIFVPGGKTLDSAGKAILKFNGYDNYTNYYNGEQNNKDSYECRVDGTAEISKAAVNFVPYVGPAVVGITGYLTRTFFKEESLTHTVTHALFGRGDTEKK